MPLSCWYGINRASDDCCKIIGDIDGTNADAAIAVRQNDNVLREQHLGPGELLVINPDDPVDLTYSQDCEKFILKLPVKLLESVCDDQRWRRPVGGVRPALAERTSISAIRWNG